MTASAHVHAPLTCDICGGVIYSLGRLEIRQEGIAYWWKCGYCSRYWWATSSAHGGQLKEWNVG